MNKARRNQLYKLAGEIERLKDMIDEVKYEEEYAYNNMPEGLQCSMRGQESEEAIDVLDDVLSSLDDVIDGLEEI